MSSVMEPDILMEFEEKLSLNDRFKNVQFEGEALVDAAEKGNYDLIVYLLNNGVSVDAPLYNRYLMYESKNYLTPLQIAAANGHYKCVQILIEHGADVNAKDCFDITPLHLAAEKGNYLCLKTLLDADAECSPPTKSYKPHFNIALPHLAGTTPLHLAAENNHVDCVRELLLYGADYNATNENGHTGLYTALKNGFRECALAIFDNAFGRDLLSIPSVDTSDTPLHFAVAHGLIDCVKILLRLGADVNHINSEGYSPLHLALLPSNKSIFHQLEIVKLLVLDGYNTDINCFDGSRNTPLHYVCFDLHNEWARRPVLAKFLISMGANVNIKNIHRISLLEYELKVTDKNSDVLKYILKSSVRFPLIEYLNFDRRQYAAHRRNYLEVREYGYGLGWFNNLVDFHRVRLFPERRRPLLEIQNLHPFLPFHGLNRVVQRGREERLVERMLFARHHRQHALARIAPINAVEESNQPPTNDAAAENKDGQKLITPAQRQEWYNKISTNPRTLQHFCRYAIRGSMGSNKVKLILKLPLPRQIKSYLLFDREENI